MRNTLILIAIATTLVGCAKTAPMRHSYHYATHQSSELNGNLVSKPDATARLNLHVFEELYNSGKVDRAAGISEETALQKAEHIKTANLGVAEKKSFANAPQAASSIEPGEAKDAKLWAEELRETYLDGYRGVQ
jgi:ABC-type transport system involved in cytochrome c biogenesis ATPase subunit